MNELMNKRKVFTTNYEHKATEATLLLGNKEREGRFKRFAFLHKVILPSSWTKSSGRAAFGCLVNRASITFTPILCSDPFLSQVQVSGRLE